METDSPTLIPAPPVVRERLSRNIKERRLLRSLLRLSVRKAEDDREALATNAKAAPLGASK